jgi:hypothetical protein
MASSSVVSELIWHFAGYLRLPPGDNYTVKILYEGGTEAGVGHDPDNPAAHPARLADTGPLHGAHLNVPIIPVLPAPQLIHITPHKFHDPHHYLHAPYIGQHLLPPLPVPSGGGGGGGGGGSNFHITVSYGSGGDNELIDVHQINAMTSNNLLNNDHHINAPIGVIAANNKLAKDLIDKMTDKAQDSVPSDLHLYSATTDQVKSWVDTNDSHPLAMQTNDAAFATQPGQYLNGVPVQGGVDPHQLTNELFKTVNDAANHAFAGPPGIAHGNHSGESIDNVSVGSNIAVNDAVITNLEGLSTSLAVQGNFYHTEAVVQTNVFCGINNFNGNGTASIAANTIQNIADVQNQVPTLTPGGSGATPSGLHWSVDVCNGNLLDIHSLVQTNYLSNNNVIYQTSAYGESDVIAGNNTLVNSAQFQNLTAKYDLIIVEGNYHQDDLIYQTNVLLDSNTVNFNGGGMASQSATGGGNNVVNDATIVDTGNHNYQQFNPDASTVLQALESQSGTLDATSVLKAFPNLFGNINVLVVTGSLYDINYICQTNVMSNSNVVQLDGSSTAPPGATQSVSSGHDTTLNAATIVDGGSALSPYLQGSYYNDMILIQTNILGNEPHIAGQNPSQLAPELVAFLEPGNGTHGPEISIAVAANSQQHHDGVAGVLH